MIERLDIFKCDECGMVMQALNDCGCGPECTIDCCGEPMKRLEAKTTDQGREKHVPVIDQTAAGVRVYVGTRDHPMTEEHHLQWIELVVDDHSYRKFLVSEQAPEAVFAVTPTGSGSMYARAYCNLHGLWQT